MKLFTVGHSNHPFEFFLGLLQKHAVDCVVDVRSVAASRFNPQFNKHHLLEELKKSGIAYLHFDRAFGARITDATLTNSEGRVDFEKVAGTPGFKQGVERLKEGQAKGYTIALMCAEADPLSCHRFGMVCRFLSKEEFEIAHILKDGTLCSQAELEEHLLRSSVKKLRKMSTEQEPDLESAYKLLNSKIGYKP